MQQTMKALKDIKKLKKEDNFKEVYYNDYSGALTVRPKDGKNVAYDLSREKTADTVDLLTLVIDHEPKFLISGIMW